MPQHKTSPRGLESLFRRLLPLGALLGSPCCGTDRTTWPVSTRGTDGGITASDGSTPTLEECFRLCSGTPAAGQVYGCALRRDGTGDTIVDCDIDYNNCHESSGRRPRGLRPASPVDRVGPIGAWLAESARLEAASVHAFRILRDELAAHGAPVALRRAAMRAAHDEVRHARRLTGLARRRGAVPARAVVADVGVRPLEVLAAENAAEGCVRETYGALVAAWQAQAAGDPVVRAVMRGVARDEARHAALAWRVAAWADNRLDRGARVRVTAARVAAVVELRRTGTQPRDPALVEAVGVPSAAHASTLVSLLDRALWSASG
ncbi:MAG: ferritin-like domain-containing protein [Deltaproteobacteria bacterium]|nr:ferritin-like domain-containing protein [Deltaproteobacteria bacterium]